MDNLLVQNVLQKIQDDMCDVAGVFACCLDSNQKKITEISGKKELLNEVTPYFTSPVHLVVLDRVQEGSLEDVAVEDLEDGQGKIAAIAIHTGHKVVAYWIVLQLKICKNSCAFERVLDLFRDSWNAYFESKMGTLVAEVNSRRSEDAYKEVSQNLETIEATAQVVQLLDSDEPVENIMEKWFNIVGDFLKLDGAATYNIYDEERFMDEYCSWSRKKRDHEAPLRHVPVYSFLKTDKPIVLSQEGVDDMYEEEAERLGIRSLMIFPLLRQGDASMVLSMTHNKNHEFAIEEIKFSADAVRVLQSIITKRVQKNSLAGSFASLEAVLDNVGSAVYVVDKKSGQVLFANQKLQNTFKEELRNHSLQDLIDEETNKFPGDDLLEFYHKSHNTWYDLAFREIRWVDGRPVTLYAFYDITDKKQYQRRIEQQAYTDFLTGLYNRMCCERDLARQIDEAKIQNKQGAILYLDLDDFKHINDGLGHQYGDVLLKSISRAFQHVEGIEKTCYRMGGDEFVLVIPVDQFEYFERIVDDVKKIFSKPWFLKDTDYYCTMSMGIVTFPDGGDSVIDLIKKADIAMYEAKKGGKNRVAKYSDSFDANSGRRLDMEKNMRDATLDGYREFLVYYQPIIDIQGTKERCIGAEALIRWNSTNLGFISPAEFIPLAEYLGLINPIGNFVLKQACLHCRQWNDNGRPDYKVNVNLSVVQLLQTDIVDIIAQTIKESGINPKNLTLEVTESLAINDMERMKGILEGIKALGVQLALDDFGTGYSSLNHIREIPFDVIKVDQSFVKDLAEDTYAKSFVKMVSELAEAIGVNICVEGIETLKQYAALHDMKVKYIQGYYFDRPMPQEEFEAKYVNN